MKISKRGEYALRALIDMGLAHSHGRELVQIHELAEQERLPVKFLEQILMQLKAAGYIASKRGKLGGYYLAKPMRQIKFGSVIRLIDGPLAPISCVSQTAYEPCTCPDEEHCGLRMLMLNVRNTLANILDRYTLADTVEVTMKKCRADKVKPPFYADILENIALSKPARKSVKIAKQKTAGK
jgi:Rrf2 family protein